MKKLLVLLLSLLMLTACGGKNDEAADNAKNNAAANTQNTAEETEEETTGGATGTITLYTSQPEQDAQMLVDEFKKSNPDAEVMVFRSGTEEVVSKILAEKEVGDVQADVILVADTVTFQTLKEKDILMSYDSKELANIDEEFYDKDKFYAATKIISTGIVVNTELYDGEVTGFKSLTDPALKDNTIMPSPLYSGAAAYNLGVLTRTDGLGWEYYQALKDNGILVDKGNGAIQTAVVAGQKAAGILVDYMAMRSKAEGAPVEFIYPEEGSPYVTEPIGIAKGTENEELAKAFFDFVISKEGQELASSMGYTPIRSDVATPEGLKGADELKTIAADEQTLLENRTADKEEFAKLFQ
ncbi:MAG: ABC transporter substrate-binding protein [Peptoniphilus sp.]|nr:ABC transporter substrate-binding protein [Peptoniphilus sp.]